MLDSVKDRVRPENTAHAIRAVLNDLECSSDWNWAWDNYKSTILEITRVLGLKQHLEIGGGRDCLFSDSELRSNGFSVTINDISDVELALAPPFAAKALCDISAKDAPSRLGRGAYDFAYCRMVMEHVHDVPQMWRNVGEILAPGGVALSFFPTLYAPAFAINRMIPERLSRAILHAVLPDRADNGDNPKFPAYYNLCRSSEAKVKPALLDAGFSDVIVLPFYGYSYFWKMPGLKQIDAAFTRLSRARDWRTVSSFAYVIAIK